ncbi:hypothetical protein sos41_12570 [Alphaproteobacteria bacterium SO-S41]|nr:hypothetical protein sos41_12570 [Alphaproteobacteria bacterium SO-S41]
MAERDAASYAAELNERGYCIVRGAVTGGLVETLRGELQPRMDVTPMCDGDFYGRRTKRVGGLLKRAPHASDFIAHRLVLDIVDAILAPHCDRWMLNLTQAIEIHPGQFEQFPHRDQDLWRGNPGKAEYLVNVMWPFTDYTRENGATLVWPGSHRVDPGAQIPDGMPDFDSAIAAEMAPGDVLLFLGSTLHGGGANRTNAVRSGMIVSYCLGWLLPYENPWLTYPPEIARHFSPELAALVGYQQHRPNLGNVDGRCPSLLLRGELQEFGAAADNLTAEQSAGLAAYVGAMTQQAAA